MWPEVTFADSLTLHFNGDDIQSHIANAHLDADVLYIFRKANVVLTGDLVFSSATARRAWRVGRRIVLRIEGDQIAARNA